LVHTARFCASLSDWSPTSLTLVTRTLKMFESDALQMARFEVNLGAAFYGFLFCIAWGCGGSFTSSERSKLSSWLRLRLTKECGEMEKLVSSVMVSRVVEDPFSFALNGQTGLAEAWTLRGTLIFT